MKESIHKHLTIKRKKLIIKLFNNSYSFAQDESYMIFFSGRIMIKDEVYTNAIEIADYLMNQAQKNNEDSFHYFWKNEFLSTVKGTFSLIAANDHTCLAAVDIIRSKPLFIIKKTAEEIVITDTPGMAGYELSIDYNKLEEFIACGLVLGENTIYKNIIALQAGEMIEIDSDKISAERYFRFIPLTNYKKFENLKEFSQKLDQVLLSSFSSMIKMNSDVNRWVIPLSGGHDSRLIVNYLHKLGIKNVLCYTYGLPDNEQSRISKKVALELGYEWHFIEYTEHEWQKLHDSGLFENYIQKSFNGVSTPHIQDLLAVYVLNDKKILKKGDIFLPGHTAATARLDKINLEYRDLDEAINSAFKYDLLTVNSIDYENEAFKSLKSIGKSSNLDPVNFRAYIHWQEKHSKFIINSLNVYEFFGFRSCLPFWDKDFVDFWLAYPANKRAGRQILFDAENQGLMTEPLLRIPYAGKYQESGMLFLKNWLRKIIPNTIIVHFLRLTEHRKELNEALNLVYARKFGTVRDMVFPLEDFPDNSLKMFKNILQRYPYQVNENHLTTLYTIRKEILDKKVWMKE